MEPTQNDIRQLNESLKGLTRQLAANQHQETASSVALKEMVEVNKRLANQLLKTNELLAKLLSEKGNSQPRRF